MGEIVRVLEDAGGGQPLSACAPREIDGYPHLSHREVWTPDWCKLVQR